MLSIHAILKFQKDFTNEITLLQLHTQKWAYQLIEVPSVPWVDRGGNQVSLGIGKLVLQNITYFE